MVRMAMAQLLLHVLLRPWVAHLYLLPKRRVAHLEKRIQPRIAAVDIDPAIINELSPPNRQPNFSGRT